MNWDRLVAGVAHAAYATASMAYANCANSKTTPSFVKTIKELYNSTPQERLELSRRPVCVMGKVKSKDQFFVRIGDGTHSSVLQLVFPKQSPAIAQCMIDTKIKITGQFFVQTSRENQKSMFDDISLQQFFNPSSAVERRQAKKAKIFYPFEIHVQDIEILGSPADPKSLIAVGQTELVRPDTWREQLYLRHHDDAHQCRMRIKDSAVRHWTRFFHQHGLIHNNPPVIVQSDCEGAGEMFRLTTDEESSASTNKKSSVTTDFNLFKQKFSSKEFQDQIQVQQTDADVTYTFDLPQDLVAKHFSTLKFSKRQASDQTAISAESTSAFSAKNATSASLLVPCNSSTSTSPSFFKTPHYLTCSSQLELEAMVHGMPAKGAWTMNPSFRAEKSNTTRHLACFQHLEAELSFVELHNNANESMLFRLMKFIQSLIQTTIQHQLVENHSDITYLEIQHPETCAGLMSKLTWLGSCEFKHVTYDDAVSILQHHEADLKSKFPSVESAPQWGDDLRSECERYLVEHHFKLPTFVYAMPAQLKAFYMYRTRKSDLTHAVDHSNSLNFSTLPSNVSTLESKNVNSVRPQTPMMMHPVKHPVKQFKVVIY